MPLFHQLNEDSSSLKLDLEQQSLPEGTEKYENIFVLNTTFVHLNSDKPKS